ncbi:MAG: metallophosphoesterase [Ruminococcus sp.]|nr:metallophosphoesterase [Ruminococcus sp.]
MKIKIFCKNYKKILISLAIIFVFIITLIFNIIYCHNTINVNRYDINTQKLKTNLRVAMISDLHMKDYGNNNEKLVNIIKQESPDIITVLGDFTVKESENYDAVLKLMPRLVNIAPTYYVLGNHELSILDTTNFAEDIKGTGVHLLINESEYFEKDGEKILIGGIKQYPYYDFQIPGFENEERYFIDNFIEKEKDNFGILLCHYPEYFMWKFNELDIDLMLCGHTHGGLIRIPFIGGFIAPEQGLFPEYDMGYFESDTAKMIVTSGLSTSSIIPRINNPGEVCIIDINK